MILRLAWAFVLVVGAGCNLTSNVDRIGRTTESLGRAPNVRGLYQGKDGSVAFETIAQFSGERAPTDARIRYVIFDASTIQKAAEASKFHDPESRTVATLGKPHVNPTKIVPDAVTAPSATPADLPPVFSGTEAVEWPRRPNHIAIRSDNFQHPFPGVAVAVADQHYIVTPGEFPRRSKRSPGGTVAFAALIGPAIVVDAIAVPVQYIAFCLSGLGR